MTSTDRQRRSYEAAARVTKERMRREAPLDADALDRVNRSDVVVVRGQYDHIEQVLAALDIPHTTIGPADLPGVRLRRQQLLVINCPGNIGERPAQRLARFVERGGSLFTTDWALKHVIVPAFPGVLGYDGGRTADEVVRIEVAEHDNPFLAGVLDEGDDPLWWLEGASYPITIGAPDRVQVLLRSMEIERKYGQAPVAVTFRHGEGEVFHMISHYYLQRAELRTARHRSSAMAWADAKGVAAAPDLEGLSYGEVESAAASTRWIANVVAAKKRRSEGK